MTTAEANSLLVDYLVHCCLYYEFDTSLITDHQFDALAARLRDAWDLVDHPHKAIIEFSHLQICPSGYYIQYPAIVRSVAERAAKGEIKLRPHPYTLSSMPS